ncbi:MAG: NapC/NirT family cytochrome c, partial [Coriobacteriia bacterium]|nr:NapC/NirT family cytochrome c [Coriobacteriia bacterium]
MARISLAGFKDPARRPRYIIWTGAAVLAMAAFVIVALGATSTRWFCAEVCHKVQDDTIIAYRASSHANISCMACHMPVNADPVTFLLHKATALGELYLTATNKFEIPLNAESHLALDTKHMPASQCTQCHSMSNRDVTPSDGIIIDHQTHIDEDITCTFCHNRVAHPEWDVQLVNVDPSTGELNRGHENFMEMTACYRCHSLEKDALAPGECSACHPEGFKLKPDNHDKTGFVKVPGEELAPHAEMAREDLERVAHATEGEGEVEAKASLLGVRKAYASSGGEEAVTETQRTEDGWHVVSVKAVSYCSTCHEKDEFCTGCHGMSIPHDAYFTEPTGTVPANAEFSGGHPEASKEKLAKCEMCHEQSKTFFCDKCHHGSKVGGWEFDTKVAWKTQHAAAVREKGAPGCLGECHDQKLCNDCHDKEKPLPSSHKAGDWLRKPAEKIGVHAESAKKEITACEVCHGAGGTDAKFCKGCHKL